MHHPTAPAGRQKGGACRCRDTLPFGRGTDAVALARFLYALRGSRQAVISADLLGEPGWDMLLDLFIASADSHRLSVSALCIGSRSAAATALRYLGLLEEHGLAERVPDATDARRCFVALTKLGHAKVERLLATALGRTASEEAA